MKVNEDNMIVISNKTERFLLVGPLFLITVALSAFGFMQSGGVHVFMIIFGLLSALLAFLYYLLNTSTPWYLPNAYQVIGDELLYAEYFQDGDDFEKLNLQLVEKIVFRNKRIKWIQIWTKDEDIIFEMLTAPMLEKCNDKWQQLFEEIRKRLPPKAEVIVK